MDIYDIRRGNLRELIRTWGGPTTLATRLGHTNGSYLAQLAGPHPTREISEKVARAFERALDLPSGYFDRAQEQRTPQSLDDELLAKCMRAVTAGLEAGAVRVDSKKFADLVSLAYSHARCTKRCDETFIQRLVGLCK